MSPQKRPKVSELAAKYLNFQAQTNATTMNTSKSYAIDLNQFLKLISSPSIFFNVNLNPPVYEISHEVKPTDSAWTEQSLIEGAIKAQRSWASLSLATRNRKASCLKSFFNWLYTEGYIQKKLSERIIAPKVPQKLPHHISVDEVLALLKTLEMGASETPNLLRDRALILLLYGAGLRVSEACGLKWIDIKASQRQILVHGKGGNERLIAAPEATFKALEKLETQGEYILGVTKPLNPRTAYQVVRDWGVRAGLLKPLTPHALRHSFATHLLSSGTNLRVLQEILGHKSLTATQKYTHLSIDKLARTVDQFHPLGKSKDSQ